MNSEDELKIFLSEIPGGVLTYRADETGQLGFISKGALELYGYTTEEEFRRAAGNCFRGMVYPADLKRVDKEIQEQVVEKGYNAVEYRILTRDGTIRWVEDRGKLVNRGGILWFYVILLDITEKRCLQQSVTHKDELYTAIASLAEDVLFDMDAKQGSIDVYGKNSKNHKVLDFIMGKIDEAGDFWTDKPCINIHSRERVPYKKKEFDINVGEDGENYWVRYQIAVINSKEHKPYRIIGRVLDNNEQKMRELEYRRKSRIDALTGIYNRNAARKAIRKLLSGESCKEGCMLLCIDVDDFKQVNDQYGHPFGDQVLIYLADKMRDFFRGNDIYARFGGDEFIVFLPNAISKERTWARVEKFAHSFCSGGEKMERNGKTIVIKISIGGVYSKDNTETAEFLYQAADVALYKAKYSGKGRTYLMEV